MVFLILWIYQKYRIGHFRRLEPLLELLYFPFRRELNLKLPSSDLEGHLLPN